MNEIVLIYITNPSREHAEDISKILVEQRLVACTNIFPIHSLFHWKGDVENDEEYVCIAKTLPEKFHLVERTVTQNHKYDVPCIIRIPVTANDSYYQWIKDEVS